MTPGVVSDWKLSKHSQKGVDCAVCHGDKHFSPETVALAEVPTPERCAYCHGPQGKQWSAIGFLQAAAHFGGKKRT